MGALVAPVVSWVSTALGSLGVGAGAGAGAAAGTDAASLMAGTAYGAGTAGLGGTATLSGLGSAAAGAAAGGGLTSALDTASKVAGVASAVSQAAGLLKKPKIPSPAAPAPRVMPVPTGQNRMQARRLAAAQMQRRSGRASTVALGSVAKTDKLGG